ncbi:hypothetical protein E2562_037666 [Oryza meyeriana var. granulata]|uniref:Transposase Tnp1/En/Spm-like domain-containing protein n=1 Tax=Oryza meyeriana var. granulata TaxID=110450 RepID=A0A6G1ETX2_9ORYZ|nr:hypothetical protein E2562_037666 [Oryza meyeriana var. granulata]
MHWRPGGLCGRGGKGSGVPVVSTASSGRGTVAISPASPPRVSILTKVLGDTPEGAKVVGVLVGSAADATEVDYAKIDECPICGESRWIDADGNKRIPQKILRHFPLIPRLKRIFASKGAAEDTRWHKLKRKPVDN